MRCPHLLPSQETSLARQEKNKTKTRKQRRQVPAFCHLIGTQHPIDHFTLLCLQSRRWRQYKKIVKHDAELLDTFAYVSFDPG